MVIISPFVAENNIHVNVSVDKSSVLRQAVSSCEYNFFKKSWVADYADEENALSLFYSKNFTPIGPNYTHYKNATFDELFEKALATTNEAERNKLYYQLEQIVIDDAPLLPIYYSVNRRLIQPYVKNFDANAMEFRAFREVWLDK